MKINKLILASVLGLSVASLADAGNVYITGSTACRGNVYSAMTTAGEVFTATPTTTLYKGGGAGATYMAFVGTLVGGSGSTTIQCDWSGSEGGIKDVATGASENFIGGTLDGTDHGSASPGTFLSAPVTLAFGDNAQSFSRTATPVVNNTAPIGVITFKWVRNNGVWNGTNVTDSQIRQAMGGFCPRAVFSGNSADTTDFVYVSGRDNQSGTRVNAFGDTGWGIFTSPSQVELDGSGNLVLLPDSTYASDFGFSSGGSLAGTLGTSTVGKNDPQAGTTGAGFSVIAYLSVGDANTAIGLGAQELTYDGVLFSAAAVKEGTYTFWGNEYEFQGNGVTTGSDSNIAYNNLAANVKNHADGIKLIKLTDMHTSRSGPTADPAHN